MSYFKKISVDKNIADVSTLNSTSSNIGATNTWSGTFEQIVDKSTIQWVGKWDRESTVYIDQGSDGANALVTDEFTYLRDIGFTGTVTSAAPYYRIRIKNNSTASEAVGELTSASTAVLNTLPRALTGCGGLRTSICGLSDHREFEIDASPNHELFNIVPYRICGGQFGSAKDTNFWAETVANSGSVTVATGFVTLNTNVTAPNGESTYTSQRNARYVAGSSCRWICQATLSAGVTNNSRKLGPFNGTDGAYFELDGDVLYAVVLKGGSATRVASTSFSNSRIIPDLTKNVTYEIYYNNAKVWFILDSELMHVVTASTATWTNEMHLKARLTTTNSGGEQTNNTIIARNCAIHKLGSDKTEAMYKNISGAVANQVLKVGPGKLHRVMVNTPGTLCSVYDNAVPNTTNPIAIIDTNKTTGLGNNFAYEIPFFNGLSVATTGSSDITVAYE